MGPAWKRVDRVEVLLSRAVVQFKIKKMTRHANRLLGSPFTPVMVRAPVLARELVHDCPCQSPTQRESNWYLGICKLQSPSLPRGRFEKRNMGSGVYSSLNLTSS